MPKTLINILFSALILFSSQSLQATPSTSAASRSLQLNELGTKAATDKRLVDAEKLFREAISLDRYNLSAAFNLASVLLALDKSNEAIKLLEDYSKANPKDAELAYRLGDAYFGAKKIPLATKSYEQAYAINPNLPMLTVKLASIYSLQNNLNKSEFYLDLATKQEPNNGNLFGNLASVKLALGKTDESIAHAKRAIQLAPTQQVYITLGNAYELKNDFKNSIIAFERAQDLGDKRPELTEKIAELKKISTKNS